MAEEWEWEQLDSNTSRMKVPGGWIVRGFQSSRIEGQPSTALSESMVFVPYPDGVRIGSLISDDGLTFTEYQDGLARYWRLSIPYDLTTAIPMELLSMKDDQKREDRDNG